jgi:DNA-binding response OmpR family regulator
VREILDQLQPRARILVVDDEPPVRNLVCQILKMAGFAVLDAPDGKAATEIVRRQKVDLVVTDLIMPEQEGIETIRTLRQKYPKTKIIAMSGAFDGEFLGTAKMLGAHAILYKPFSAAEILRAVDEVLKS